MNEPFGNLLYPAGHFLLTHLLLDTMKATAKECGEEGRIVIVSSMAHLMTYRNHDLDHINDPKRYFCNISNHILVTQSMDKKLPLFMSLKS